MAYAELQNFVVVVSDEEDSSQSGDKQSTMNCSSVGGGAQRRSRCEAFGSREGSPESWQEMPPAQRRCHRAVSSTANASASPSRLCKTEGDAGAEAAALHVDATLSHIAFEADDSSCDEFIPFGAQRTRSCEVLAPLVREDIPPRAPPLPSALRALLPTDTLSAPGEIAALGSLTADGAASKALRFVAEAARPLSRASEKQLERRLRSWGYKPASLARVLAYIRDEAAIIVHIDLASRLPKLLKDSHYRNQFETGSTRGSSNLEKRRSWEDRLFSGIYENAEAVDRVKYGVLNMVNDPCGIANVAKQYGADYLVLRGVRLRTTFSDRDSCNQGQLASCEWYAHVLAQYTDLELRAVLDVALGERLFVDSKVLDTAAGGYKEVQIHGELEFEKHVEAVVAHPSHRNTPLQKQLQTWCERIGARLEFMPEAGNSNVPAAIVAENPVWRWRPSEGSEEGQPWVRFNAFDSAALEASFRQHGEGACESSLLWSAGTLVSVDFASMTAMAQLRGPRIAGERVELALQRRTAGACARERTTGQRGSATWEWCASASGDGFWRAYASKLSKEIEAAFKRKLPSTVIALDDGSTYHIDLELFVQINERTRYRRLVRRAQGTSTRASS
eukprot:TRINITY_DN6576_c0_g1_i2.p1 TRINITY_DN6576_c0_g1~~TRINITY_DN6576_c0_g1_i2.p1  ORF type:complete len:641 (-),score=147.14 TRINITY_DN6576_c0_g1_i2:46-1902(-)